MMKLNIDPFFRDKIPPLTDDEFNQLRENILNDGEVYEPLIVWDNTIVDGHNRWRIICENWETLKDKFKTKSMEFPDKWSAAEWMCKKQLGRRNLSDDQKAYTIGQAYEMRKNRGNQYTVEKSAARQNAGSKSGREVKDGTAGVIGKEMNVSARYVDRAGKFAKAVDHADEIVPGFKDAILTGKANTTQQLVRSMNLMTDEEVKDTAEKILRGEKPPTNNAFRRTKEKIAERAETEAVIATMYDPNSVPEYTIEFLVDEIMVNADQYIQTLRNTLTDRAVLLTPENRPIIADAVGCIINEIEKVRNLLK